jgi:uncharacterized membrane protein HdeD (DUF308 family)
MPATEIQGLEVQFSHDLVQYWGWFLALGAALLLLGIAAVARAVTATVASMLFFGWLLVLAGAIEGIQAVAVGHWAGFFQHLFAAILFLVAGFILAFRPVISAEVLTLFMALFFLIGGLFQLVGSLWVGLPGWGWSALDGVITFILGLLVLAQWPASGLWVIGLFIGIDLILYGLAGSRLRLVCAGRERSPPPDAWASASTRGLRRAPETARDAAALSRGTLHPHEKSLRYCGRGARRPDQGWNDLDGGRFRPRRGARDPDRGGAQIWREGSDLRLQQRRR